MAYLHHESHDCTLSELDLFSLPPTNTQTESGVFVNYQPVAAISDYSAIEFFVPGADDAYTDLANILLHVQCRITNSDGSALPENAKVAPANNFLHSLFSQVELHLNDRLINTSSNTYPYRAYFESLLNYGGECKQSQLSSQFFFHDLAGKMDEIDGNTGASQRRNLSGGVIDLIGRPHLDLFHQDRYLLNHVNMKLRFYRSKPQFCLLTHDENAGYKIAIDQATLYVRKVKLFPSIVLAHENVLRKTTMKWPFNRVELKTFTINSGLSSITRENITLGVLPERIILGFVDAEAFNGNYKRNPFNFHHHNLSFLSVYVNGAPTPSTPLEMDYGKGAYVRAYHTLFSALDKHYRDVGNNIGRDDYPNGYAIYGFDLTPDLKAGGVNFSLVRQGNLRVEARFDKPLDRALYCVMFIEFDSILEIDSDRNVHLDYSV